MGLFDTMTIIAQEVIDSQPQNSYGTVKSYYDGAVTVETQEGSFENIKCVNIPKVGSPCLLIPVGNQYNCIPNEIEDNGGSGDLSAYVKKDDVKLKFDLEDNGTIILGIDVGDGF